MHVEQLVQYLDSPGESEQWLRSLRVENTLEAHKNLLRLSESGLTSDLMAIVCTQLSDHLVHQSDPDMALRNLARFVDASRNPIALGCLIERDTEALPILLQLFSTSQYLADVMIGDPASFDLLRMTDGQPVELGDLVREMRAEVESLADLRAVMRLLRVYKRRETLRIAYGDVVVGHPLEKVTQQNSFLADGICEAARRSAQLHLEKRFGHPQNSQQRTTRFVVLGLGRLGGRELDYSGEIKLFFVYEADGKTSGPKSIRNREYFERLVEELVELLSDSTELGPAYMIDQRLRPHGHCDSIVTSRDETVQYFDVLGRTWERQAMSKARPVAGDLDFGYELLGSLEHWMYHRYLNRSDITELKALKRRLEKRTHGPSEIQDIKDGRGGIRDIEFVIQFLQLLNGGDLKAVRPANTLEAITALEHAGCLTAQERSLLEENYRFLRRIEHRLQILIDLGKRTLPETDGDLRKLAIRSGYEIPNSLTLFRKDLEQKTAVNRKILNHLLHDAFGDDSAAAVEIDLILDPDPTNQLKQQVLGPYRFRDVPTAYKNLMTLAEERVPFLSTRRCRHFVAAISPKVLAALAKTPNPDTTLSTLSRVSDSLGGKGVLWELFSVNPPSLQLYIKLCAASPYLAGILQNQPGMIDELMDALVLKKLPSYEALRDNLDELTRQAEDPELILHSFKDAQHLRVGVRDLLGKQDIRSTTATLSDIAEVCLQHVVRSEYERLVYKYGAPKRQTRDSEEPCELVVLALGKLGGREPNYHSDLDVLFLYEEAGVTKHEERSKSGETTTNQHFFSQLGQRTAAYVNRVGPHGRLFELDPKLRPTGNSGSVAISFADLHHYFSDGGATLSDRQALCRARPIYGSKRARNAVLELVQQWISQPQWTRENAKQLAQTRHTMQESASPVNLKRAPGGTLDVEFLVQMLQMSNARKYPGVLAVGVGESLTGIENAQLLDTKVAASLRKAYASLRAVEARLRLMNTVARHDLPDPGEELEKLAFLMDHDNPQELVNQCKNTMATVRQIFDSTFSR